MLSATELVDAEPVLASSLPVDPSILTGLAQAAPVVMGAGASSAFGLGETFLLHSNPTAATRTIYLDFDGNTTTGTQWNSNFNNGDPIVTPAYSFEGDSNFSDNELSRIQYIWQRVAEDYLPFNVDVTTEDPGSAALIKSIPSDTEYGVRVCIGGSSSDWYGANAGGVAYMYSFKWNTDTPAFVFPAMLGNGSEKYTAEAISHETGHTLGLSHDGTNTAEYYEGHGSGATGWAAIMGVGYYKSLTQFSKGEYPDANNQQDDLAVLAGATGGFGYRSDDHGSSFAEADTLTVIGNTGVSDDGIIERTSDLDYFSFETGQGAVSLSIDPAPRGPNLDILATLYDSLHQLVATNNPVGALNASFSLTLAAGTYYLVIDGAGEGDLATGYSDYDSLGYYSITGTIVDPNSLPWLTIAANDASAGERGADTGTFTVSRTGSTVEAMEVFYAVTGSADNGVDYDTIPNSVTIPAGSYTAEVTIHPIDDSSREGDETVILTLDAGEGFYVGVPGFDTVTIADDDLVFTVDDFAASEATTAGDVTGSLADTPVSDNVCEQLTEVLQFRWPHKTYSVLDHTWTFDVTGGWNVTFSVEAYHSVNDEADDFLFEYSTDGANWTALLTVTKTADDNALQQAAMPGNLSGTVFIRVTDTDRTKRHTDLDSVFIDRMFIRNDPSIAGDANVDGIVDVLDYMTIKRSMGTAGAAAWSDGDFDNDGDVDYWDLTTLQAHFGETVSLASPTPLAAPAPISPARAPVTDPGSSPEESAKRLGAMSAAARNACVDVFAAATSRLTMSPFALSDQSPSLPWWLRPKRDR